MVASFVRNVFLYAGPLQEDNKRDKINKWINQRRRYFMKSLVGRHVVAAGRRIRNAHDAIILLNPMPSSWFTKHSLIFCNNWEGIHYIKNGLVYRRPTEIQRMRLSSVPTKRKQDVLCQSKCVRLCRRCSCRKALVVLNRWDKYQGFHIDV